MLAPVYTTRFSKDIKRLRRRKKDCLVRRQPIAHAYLVRETTWPRSARTSWCYCAIPRR